MLSPSVSPGGEIIPCLFPSSLWLLAILDVLWSVDSPLPSPPPFSLYFLLWITMLFFTMAYTFIGFRSHPKPILSHFDPYHNYIHRDFISTQGHILRFQVDTIFLGNTMQPTIPHNLTCSLFLRIRTRISLGVRHSAYYTHHISFVRSYGCEPKQRF